MAQPWSYRYPLIDFHGNKGSYDGDSPAAYRYTEGRLNKLAEYMLAGIDKDAVDMIPNYSETDKEPVQLPSTFPMMLTEGTTGIAVGYTTAIPSHQLGEICDAIIATLHNQDITLDELLKIVKGPDYRTGAYLIKNEQIRKLYETGRGKLSYKARYNIEELPNGAKSIVITQLPPEVKKPPLIEKLYNLCILQKKIPRVSAVKDYSTDIDNIKIVIELQKTAVVDLTVKSLFDMTELSSNVSYVIRAIQNNAPKLFSLKELIDCYIDNRRECIRRESIFDKHKAECKLHILDGLHKITSNIKKAITIIEAADNVTLAKEALEKTFNIDDSQAEAVLEMKLRRLTKLDKDDIKNTIKELQDKIALLSSRIQDVSVIDDVIIEQVKDIKDKFNDKRYTEIISESKNMKMEEVSDEPLMLVLTNKNNIKHLTVSAFNEAMQNGVLKERQDIYTSWMQCTMSDKFIVITEDGNYIKLEFNDLLSYDFPSRVVGMHIIDDSEKAIFVMTRKGIVQKIKLSGFKARFGKPTAIFKDLKDDIIIGSKEIVSNDDNVVIIATESNLVHRFHEGSFKETLSAGGKGIAGIKLDADDSVLAFDITSKTDDDKYKIVLFTIHDNTYGMKAIAMNDVSIKGRMSHGVNCLTFKKKNPGKLYTMKVVKDDISLVDKKGKVQTIKFDDLTVATRAAKPENIKIDLL